jgi:arginase
MPLAALCGLPSETEGAPDREWRQLLDALGPDRLDPERIAWMALRDVDASERDKIRGFATTMHTIDRFGIERTVSDFDNWMRESGATRLWISFDVDALDPILAPGTGTAVRGGLTYREGHLLAELLHEKLSAPSCPYRLAGIDVVETNPLQDTNNATAKVAVEWVASLLGKTILDSTPNLATGNGDAAI